MKNAFIIILLLMIAAGVFFARYLTDSRSLVSPERRNVVFIMIDTLRADHLGSYGYERPTSPNMDRLANRGWLFENAYAASNWTNPSIMSMFSGLTASSVMEPAFHKKAIKMPLPEAVKTFAEHTRTAGYHNAALVDHPGINRRLGFGQGFHYWEMLFRKGDEQGRGWGKSDISYVANQFGDQLTASADQPFLIYVHVVYPHRPYKHTGEHQGRFGEDTYDSISKGNKQRLINAYDALIREADDLVGLIHAQLEERGLLDSTWVILTSDHGEGFWEHHFAEHGKQFFQEVIGVPLILAPPTSIEVESRRIQAPVSNMDVYATILDIAGLSPGEGIDSRSLITTDYSSTEARSRVLFSQNPHSWDIRGQAVIHEGIKYMRFPGIRSRLRHWAFDLTNDPGESTNLRRNGNSRISELGLILDRQQEQAEIEREWLAQELVDPDEETLEGLKSLGYIQ